MKKLILVFAILIASACAYAIITTPYSNDYGHDGNIITRDKVFIIVKNASTSTVYNGNVVTFSATNKTDAGNIAVTLVNDQYGRGIFSKPVCVAAEDITSSSIGKCQVFGYHSGITVEACNNLDGGHLPQMGEAVHISPKQYGFGCPFPTKYVTQADWSTAASYATILEPVSATGAAQAFIHTM